MHSLCTEAAPDSREKDTRSGIETNHRAIPPGYAARDTTFEIPYSRCTEASRTWIKNRDQYPSRNFNATFKDTLKDSSRLHLDTIYINY